MDGDSRWVAALEVTFVKTSKAAFEEGFVRAIERDGNAVMIGLIHVRQQAEERAVLRVPSIAHPLSLVSKERLSAIHAAHASKRAVS